MAQPKEKAYQMLWDCRFCGTPKLLGIDHRHCPNCGAKQDPDWRYFPSESDKVLIDSPNYEYAGVDKICPFCQQPNSAAANFCKECGGDLSAAKVASVKDHVVTGSATHTGQREDLVAKNFQMQQNATKKKGGGVPRILIVIVALALLGIGGFIFLSRSTFDAKVMVSDIQWERVIQVEQYRTFSGTDWRNEVPGGAYSLSCRPEQRAYTRTIQEQCGTVKQDRGDGSFVEKPKYCDKKVTDYKTEDKCSYKVDKWVDTDLLKTTGGPNDPLAWPNFTPSTTSTVLGAERERYREQNLLVIFTDTDKSANGKQYTYETEDENKWRQFKVEQVYSVKINRLGVVQWDTLKQ
jgi:hypothetical protein